MTVGVRATLRATVLRGMVSYRRRGIYEANMNVCIAAEEKKSKRKECERLVGVVWEGRIREASRNERMGGLNKEETMTEHEVPADKRSVDQRRPEDTVAMRMAMMMERMGERKRVSVEAAQKIPGADDVIPALAPLRRPAMDTYDAHNFFHAQSPCPLVASRRLHHGPVLQERTPSMKDGAARRGAVNVVSQMFRGFQGGSG